MLRRRRSTVIRLGRALVAAPGVRARRLACRPERRPGGELALSGRSRGDDVRAGRRWTGQRLQVRRGGGRYSAGSSNESWPSSGSASGRGGRGRSATRVSPSASQSGGSDEGGAKGGDAEGGGAASTTR